MRLIFLIAALTVSVSARPDPRAPFDSDALRSATGIMAFAEVPVAPSGVHAKFHYDTVPVAKGITTFIEGPSHGLVQGNITLIVGEQSALVIDTGQFPAVARRVIADMRKLTDKPVRYVAITHWHMDHYMANSEFADAWPGLTIIAQDFTAPMMDKYGGRYQHYGPKVEENLKPMRDMLASGKAPDGTELDCGPAPAHRDGHRRSRGGQAGIRFDALPRRRHDVRERDRHRPGQSRGQAHAPRARQYGRRPRRLCS